MGIDIHALQFLRYAKKKMPLGDTITIGRQGIHLNENTVKSVVGTKPDYKKQIYCEELLTGYFGSTRVRSTDNSDFEGATYIHDMNQALPPSLHGQFDSVLDLGCLEHIFNIPQALKNCSLFCKPGGQIIHVLPANNFCGHGFWQFSPELFFSLYSAENGYEQTEVYLAALRDNRRWYRVTKPHNGKRVNIVSSGEVYALVRTVRTGKSFSHNQVQQSDYQFEWKKSVDSRTSIPNESGGTVQTSDHSKRKSLLLPISLLLLNIRTRLNSRLNARNPDLTMVEIGSVV